jgi:hypothetical protein
MPLRESFGEAFKWLRSFARRTVPGILFPGSGFIRQKFLMFVLIVISCGSNYDSKNINTWSTNIEDTANEIYHKNYKSISKASFLSSNPDGIVEPYIGSVG